MDGVMKLLLLSILLLTVSCAAIDRKPLPYTTSDKVLTTALFASHAIDTYQTHVLSHHPKFEEGNPAVIGLFGKEVDWYEIAPLKLVILAPLYYVYVYKAPTLKTRKIVLWLLNTVALIPVISNSAIGGGVLIKFNP
jgi:hypothetical protein